MGMLFPSWIWPHFTFSSDKAYNVYSNSQPLVVLVMVQTAIIMILHAKLISKKVSFFSFFVTPCEDFCPFDRLRSSQFFLTC